MNMILKNLTVRRDLKVEGWLDAPNIRGFLKGLYASPEDLYDAWPRPANGWAALVGDTLPARVYRAWEGRWIWTGQTGGAPQIEGDPGLETRLQQLESALAVSLKAACGLRTPEIAWNAGMFLTLDADIATAREFRLSEPFTLHAGETLEATLQTSRVAQPIAVVSDDDEFLFPAVGMSDDTERRFTYYAPETCRVVLSCLGEPTRIEVMRRQGVKIENRLISAMGRRIWANTAVSNGGRLLYDGRITSETGYGFTPDVDVSGATRVHYRGVMPQGATANAVALYINREGAVEGGLCRGTKTPDDSRFNLIGCSSDLLDFEFEVPRGCTAIRFGHYYGRGPQSEPFEIEIA